MIFEKSFFICDFSWFFQLCTIIYYFHDYFALGANISWCGVNIFRVSVFLRIQVPYQTRPPQSGYCTRESTSAPINPRAKELERAAVDQAKDAMAATARAAGTDETDLTPGAKFDRNQTFIIFDWYVAK